MDLRTMSDGLHAAGRKLSPSGISKLEAGDRRVDVDDLTVIAYLLRTTPAALLTPPDEQTTLTGVPEGYEPEEIDRWMRGELLLTDEGLFNYWQQEWVICTDRIHHLETTLEGMTAPSKDDPEKTSAHPKTIAAYQERLETARARARVIQERGVQLDPDGRVFNAKDYIDNYAGTHQPGQTTARSTLS
jgi:transcriptional regulator with XRE-family HTH domain